jgi:hypothetical protein
MSNLVDTYSEEYRHQCEIRQILRWRVQDRNKALSHIERVREQRGDAAAKQLENDARSQWNKGNRGIKGEWK